MNILIAGAGAIGCVLGRLLGKAGHDVTLVGRQQHMRLDRETGPVEKPYRPQ